MKRDQQHIAIVGAGIVGLAHAYLAAKMGHRVSVFERNPEASGASVRNFGMIWPIGQPPGEIHQMAMRSRQLWLALLQAARLPYLAEGSLHAAYREDEESVGREFAEAAPSLGYDCQWLDAAATLAKSPALRPQGLRGALWSASEMTVDPHKVIAAIPLFLAEKHGVQFHFNSAVTEIAPDSLRANNQRHGADVTILASGDDFQTLYPQHFTAAGVTRCKLQMMRTVPQPDGWKLGPSLAFGLTFRHYPTFEVCRSLKALKQRVHEETPEFDRWHIHVMASENASRQITLGDSHEYGEKVSVFDRADIDNLILRYAGEYLRVPDLRVAERWHGVYAKHPQKVFLRLSPEDSVRIVTVTTGVGMTLSFGLAEQTYRELGMVMPQ